jgi:hypothetical protein
MSLTNVSLIDVCRRSFWHHFQPKKAQSHVAFCKILQLHFCALRVHCLCSANNCFYTKFEICDFCAFDHAIGLGID